MLYANGKKTVILKEKVPQHEQEQNVLMLANVNTCFRHLLHHCFQALMDHGVRVSEILADAFEWQKAQTPDKLIQLGFALGLCHKDTSEF